MLHVPLQRCQVQVEGELELQVAGLLLLGVEELIVIVVADDELRHTVGVVSLENSSSVAV